jgi:hypothetical protein
MIVAKAVFNVFLDNQYPGIDLERNMCEIAEKSRAYFLGEEVLDDGLFGGLFIDKVMARFINWADHDPVASHLLTQITYSGIDHLFRGHVQWYLGFRFRSTEFWVKNQEEIRAERKRLHKTRTVVNG